MCPTPGVAGGEVGERELGGWDGRLRGASAPSRWTGRVDPSTVPKEAGSLCRKRASPSCVCMRARWLQSSVQPHGPERLRLLCLRGFSRQEYWSGLPCPPLGDLPKPGIESLLSPALAAGFRTARATWAALPAEG